MQILAQIKGFKPQSKNCLLGVENEIFHLFLLLNLIFSLPKDVRLNSKHYLIMKINNKRVLPKLHLIFLQVLIAKILRKFIENVQKNYIIF